MSEAVRQPPGGRAVKRALICGISGQDGAYLAKLLLDQGYEVAGTSRDAQVSHFGNLEAMGIRQRIRLLTMAPNDFRSVLQVISDVMPDEIYNLTGQSSVGLSFQQPVETFEGIVGGTLNLLEAIRFLQYPVRLYNACSGECFGDTEGKIADEATAFRPKSPYGVARAASFWMLANYRESYGLYVCSGILFNHESPLRPARFVTRKIVSTACRIANGSKERLQLGNVSVIRDWGWAPEYVEAMWKMLQQQRASDFVIATGESHSLQEFVNLAFEYCGLNWREHVDLDRSLERPSEIRFGCGNAAKAEREMGWRARYRMSDVVRGMVDAEMRLVRAS
jgi:GDPmannose 4,6-dehydratase